MAGTSKTRLGGYRSYQELLDTLDDFVGEGADVLELGHSVAGLPLPALATGPREASELSLIVAGIHPLEWIGVEVALALFQSLLACELSRRVLFVPVLNVDGYRRVESDLRAGRRRFRRSNLRGVDLNRNFPTSFKSRRRLLPGGWNFGGKGPRSEPEVDGLCRLLERETAGRSLKRALSLHSFSKKLILPFGGRWARPADWDEHAGLARQVNAGLGQKYRILQASRWVPGAFGHGMEIDTFHEEFSAHALLVECSAGGFSLAAPATWLSPFAWFNPAEPEPVAEELAAALLSFVS